MKKVIWTIVVLAFIGFVAWLIVTPGRVKVSKFDSFAMCIKDSGAVFYGAFWCPHCQTQKKMFESAEQYLPYVECSTPDGKGQLKICQDKKITGYPTWIFKDGSQLSGEVPLKDLAEKTSCVLPQ
jgi:hypothetical protein